MIKKIILSLICFLFCTIGVFADEAVFTTLDGKEISYHELTKPSKTVLFIWTTWCPSCQKQLIEYSKNCSFPKDVNFVFVDLGESASTVKRAVTNLKIKECVSDKIVLDPKGYLGNQFSVIAVPTYILLKDGEPVYKTYFLDDHTLEKVFGNDEQEKSTEIETELNL